MTPRLDSVAPVRGWRPQLYPALPIAACCWAGFGVVGWLVVRGATDRVDRAGLLMWRGADLLPLGPAWLDEWVRDVTALGGALLRNLFALGVVVALLFLRRRRAAGLFAAIVLGGWLIDDTLKNAIGRVRPAIVPHLVEAAGSSFPSTHSFSAAVIYLTSALIFAAATNRRAVRATLLTVAAIAVLAIGWSRVWLGVHYPSDVLAGWLGGIGWVASCAAVSALLQKRQVRNAGEPTSELGAG